MVVVRMQVQQHGTIASLCACSKGLLIVLP